MADQWIDVPIDAELFQNLDEESLRRSPAAMENAYINEAKGHNRFPGLRPWKQLPVGGDVILTTFRGNLVAFSTQGQLFRLDQAANAEDVTGVVPTGSGRISFARTEKRLLMARGGPIVQLAGNKTELLGGTVPNAIAVGYLGSFGIAVEPDSQIVRYSASGDDLDWPELNFFSAESRPDNITAMTITEFGEMILAGPDSVEQYEAYPGGDVPFFRRWSNGEGVLAPDTLVSGDANIFAISRLSDFTRYQGQNAKPEGSQIKLRLEAVKDWTGAWSALMSIFGQKFCIIQAPNWPNEYGSMGITFCIDYRAKRWTYLYGWSDDLNVPAAWPGKSYASIWGDHFVGGTDGMIYKLDATYFLNNGKRQQMYWRSAHMDQWNKTRIDGLRVRLKRGDPINGYDSNPDFQIRMKQDNRKLGRWQTGKLGPSGDNQMYIEFGAQGTADTWQMEYRCGANTPVSISRIQVLARRVD